MLICETRSRGNAFGLPEDLLAAARATHLRRALEQAVDHGTALLAALGLPRLVTAEFVPIDTEEVGAALDLAIATFDALDAPWEDLEDGHDAEHDTADMELSCGWTAKVSQLHLGHAQDDHETTALERFGRGFIRSGLDDAEEDDTAEMDDEPEGDGGEPYLSVVEYDGRGDNWGRSGHCTSGQGTDVEDVNEGDGEQHDAPWWRSPSHPACGAASLGGISAVAL